MKLAIKELVTLGVFELENGEPHPSRSGLRPPPIPTERRPAGGDGLLAWTDRAIRLAPLTRGAAMGTSSAGRLGRSAPRPEGREVARRAGARRPREAGTRRLAGAQAARRLWRRETVRTPAGDAALAAAENPWPEPYAGEAPTGMEATIALASGFDGR